MRIWRDIAPSGHSSTSRRTWLPFSRQLAIFGVLVGSHLAVPHGPTNLHAQISSAPVASSQGSAERYTINGTVVDAVTGEPVRKALVQIYANQRRMIFTDSDGRFQLEGIAAGSYTVMAQKPGYFNDQELMRGAPVLVEVGPKPATSVLKLTPEATLAGKVATSAGQPLERVTLHLTCIEIREGRRHWDYKGSATTDVDGRYRMANLRPGDCYLFVSPHAPQPESLFEADRRPTAGYPGMYFSGAVDLSSATAIELKPGEQVEANFALSEVPVYSVSGMIVGYGANQGVGIQIVDPSGMQVDCAVQFSAENGRFDVGGLPAGNYVIKAFSSMPLNQQVRAEQPIHLAGDLHNLRLALGPSPTIPVNVQMEPTRTPNGPRAASRIAQGGPPISVRLAGTQPNAAEVYATFDKEHSSQLLLQNIEPGRYTAVIDSRESWYVASAEYGQTNLLTDDLVLAPGSPPLPINVVLRNDSASVTGTVTVPDGFTTQVTIVAVPQRSSKGAPGITYWYPPRDKSTQPPEFHLDSLAPGDYELFAFDRADGIEYTNRDVIQSYESMATQVTLAPSQRAKIALQLARTAELKP